MKRIAKIITNQKDIDELLNIKEEDITNTLVMELFGQFDSKPRFNPYDIITIPKGSYHNNKNNFTTTIGLWIYNKFFIDKDLFDILGYVNQPITKKIYKKLNSTITYAYLEDKISQDTFKNFAIKYQKCMPYISILSPSQTEPLLTISSKINVKKKALLTKYKKELEEDGKELVMDRIETELLKYAKELLKDDPGMDLYNSGARASFENNFKNMYICKGVAKNPDPNKGYNIITSNYMDGINKEEYAAIANTLAAGPFARSNKTQLGGYWEKLFMSGYQHVILDPAGSDCKTADTLKIHLTNENKSSYMYSYMKTSNGNLVELNSDIIDKYVGKDINIRYSSLCKSKTGYCNKCAGNLFYKLGIMNIGCSTPVMPSKLKNLSMKSFHDSTIQYIEIDPMKAFSINESRAK